MVGQNTHKDTWFILKKSMLSWFHNHELVFSGMCSMYVHNPYLQGDWCINISVIGQTVDKLFFVYKVNFASFVRHQSGGLGSQFIFTRSMFPSLPRLSPVTEISLFWHSIVSLSLFFVCSVWLVASIMHSPRHLVCNVLCNLCFSPGLNVTRPHCVCQCRSRFTNWGTEYMPPGN